ncbi:hypothetical protein [Glycomyces sp. MUSA5-2]|uniref:hypothetical protein n=1 Tax=Glycomyces sp. MUSA5-2 TaxID=2053002 RepID=UPI0030092F02
MTQHHHNRASHPPQRYGSFDVPLTVWSAADAADVTAHLFAELKPARGPIAVVDLPGWDEVCRAGRRAVVFGTNRGAFARTLASLPTSKQGLGIFQALDADSAATRIAKLEGAAGLALASARALTWPGAPAALVGVLRPGGLLAVIGRTDADAAAMTEFNRPRPGPKLDATAHAVGLEFTGYVVAAPKRAFDTAVASAINGEATPHRPCAPLTRHFDIAIWTRATAATGGAK